jgi:serine/threonine protein kinase
VQVTLCELRSSPWPSGITTIAIKQPSATKSVQDSRTLNETKRLLARMDAPREALKLLTAECRVHEMMDHGHIVKFLGRIPSRKHPQLTAGIVLEHCPVPRAKWAEECMRNAEVRLSFMQHSLQALSYVHSKGYVHMDIKLANFLATQGTASCPGQFKLADFGLSMKAGQPLLCGPVGTPKYMAPEVFFTREKCAEAHPSMDVWSWGATMVDLLSGQRWRDLWPSTNIANEHVRLRQLHKTGYDTLLPDIQAECLTEGIALHENISHWEWEIIRLCLHKDHHKRPTVDELLAVVDYVISWHQAAGIRGHAVPSQHELAAEGTKTAVAAAPAAEVGTFTNNA